MLYEKKERYKLAFMGINHVAKPRYHLHNELEIVFNMGNGALAEVFINHKKYLLNPNHGVIIMPGQIHTANNLSNGTYLLISMPIEYLLKISNFLLSKTPANPIFSTLDPEIKKTLFSLWADSDVFNKISDQNIVHSYILGYTNVLLAQLINKLEFIDNGKENELFKSIVLYIAENYTSPITLSDISNKLNVPTAAISKVFNATAGITIPCHLNWVRASAAADMLVSSDKTITEIANIVGFGTIRNFNRAFTEFFKVTPSEYRKSKAQY